MTTAHIILLKGSVVAGAVALLAMAVAAQTAKDVKGATPLVAIANEPPAQLIVDPPIPEQLALGRVFIQYRTENLRILPVFGAAALSVSPLRTWAGFASLMSPALYRHVGQLGSRGDRRARVGARGHPVRECRSGALDRKVPVTVPRDRC